MIDDQAALDRLVSQLAGQRVLAIDCEMDSMYAYGTSLCLVQVGWPDGEALIDGLVDLDRSGLGALFADPSVVKVLHGGENDVGLLRDRWGLHFENVFDTMIASQVLGHDGCGLAAVLDRHFDVHVSKKYQKADWRVRPLPEEQADYAAMDVRFLLPLRETLTKELESLGRVDEAVSDFARVAAACIPERPFDPDNWVRVKGSRDIPAKHRAVLRALYAARDAIAQRLDRAPYRVLHDGTLLELTRRMPKDDTSFRKLRGTNRHLSAQDVASLLRAMTDGSEVGEIPLPRRPGRRRPWEAGESRLDPKQDKVFKALRNWRAKRAKTRGVDVSRVATTALLVSISRSVPEDLDALAAVEGMEPWRMREYGEAIVAAVAKSLEE
jgi:ribonuclease D